MRRLDLATTDTDVVLGGGILASNDPVLMEPLKSQLRESAPSARVRLLRDPPVVGAALLGLEKLWNAHPELGPLDRAPALSAVREAILSGPSRVWPDNDQSPQPRGARTMTEDARMRIGLVGTGYWARETHAPGIDGAPEAALTAVWGRNPAATDTLAQRHRAIGYADFDEFLGQVDAVSFSVPPDVQATLAVRAAEAGKHLLLEKPIALDEQAADALVASVQASGVAALVFFTHLFSPPVTTLVSEHRRCRVARWRRLLVGIGAMR